MQTTFSFPSGIFWRSIAKQKTKETVTITQLFLTAASLAQVDNVPNKADSKSFCCDTRGLDSRLVTSFYFGSVLLLLSKTFVSL